MNLKWLVVLSLLGLLMSCATPPPPGDLNNVCHIFTQYPNWYSEAKDVERRWRVPVPVQMAILHQESKFDAHAQPPRTKLFSIIPWKRPTTAYGYSQALRPTWALYKKALDGGNFWASRGSFADAVDFVGWYANQAYRRAGIPRKDAYPLYLAYHEGVGGYQHKTYLKKPWLIQVARKVKLRSKIYQVQLQQCQNSLKTKPWYK